MKIRKIHDYKNGEAYVYKSNTVKHHICCDCNLAHFIHVDKIKNGKCITYWYRDDDATRRLRKKEKKEKT